MSTQPEQPIKPVTNELIRFFNLLAREKTRLPALMVLPMGADKQFLSELDDKNPLRANVGMAGYDLKSIEGIEVALSKTANEIKYFWHPF